MLYLRLVYFPFTPMNFGMGLTKVRFRDYLWGTGLGILVGTFIFTFFVGTIKEVWASGQWVNLLTWKIFFSLGLFVFSLFIPKIIDRLKVWKKVKQRGFGKPAVGGTNFYLEWLQSGGGNGYVKWKAIYSRSLQKGRYIWNGSSWCRGRFLDIHLF